MRTTGLFVGVLALALLVACPEGGGPRRHLSSQAAVGRKVFLEKAAPACGTCHTLAEAGSVSSVGPDLDDLQPEFEMVRMAVTYGLEAMPSQAGILTSEEIDALARYVAEVAGHERGAPAGSN